MTDELDAQILHALQLAPRVSFRRIASVVGATEQTVARRYHRLRRDGVVRVVGLENRWADGDADWVCRIRAAPDRISRLADALVRRPDVSHANVLAGWTDLVCVIRAPLGDTREDLLTQLLPRTAAVTDISIDLMLHSFGDPVNAPGRATAARSRTGKRSGSWPRGPSRSRELTGPGPPPKTARCSRRSPTTAALRSPNWPRAPVGRWRG